LIAAGINKKMGTYGANHENLTSVLKGKVPRNKVGKKR